MRFPPARPPGCRNGLTDSGGLAPALRALGPPVALRLPERGIAGAVYSYSMGIRPSVGMSPGRTLLRHAIAFAAREGYDEFYLLRGEHAFKCRLASNHRTDRPVVPARFTPRGLLGAGTVVARSLLAPPRRRGLSRIHHTRPSRSAFPR